MRGCSRQRVFLAARACPGPPDPAELTLDLEDQASRAVARRPPAVHPKTAIDTLGHREGGPVSEPAGCCKALANTGFGEVTVVSGDGALGCPLAPAPAGGPIPCGAELTSRPASGTIRRDGGTSPGTAG